jgi:ribosome-binding protein aMBF1 (putative translation factor)
MALLVKFAHLVREERIKQGMSQLELSIKAFDKPHRTKITGIESGYIDGLTFATADRLTQALNIDVEFTVIDREKPTSDVS